MAGPRGKRRNVVVFQLGRRAGMDAAANATADARVRRVEHRLGRRSDSDDTDVVWWIGNLARMDQQIRLRDGDRLRYWVTRRLATVRRAESVGAFTPADVALHDARFLAGLHRDQIAAVVSDLRSWRRLRNRR
ncbi:hypothetical protein Rhe02_81030 [Rhizocola hellebori]|uniref:Uncharacterized protein n=1 Tax=Rhizocola hellebori TaxID=1392758 RepID=A0A8J3QGC6_9ACTN|nr:hypothetical protein [Rhizocola hellebori]GIH10036.1 hypothetical protein Rhe02_81030 [Rhizocola hellebori]